MKTAEEILKSKLNPAIAITNNADYTFNKIIEAMETYANQSKWISVEDRLPKLNTEVICCDGPKNSDVSTSYFVEGGFYKIDENGVINSFEVTHWQPLPEKP